MTVEEIRSKGDRIKSDLEINNRKMDRLAAEHLRIRDIYNQKVMYFNSLTPPSWIWQTKRIDNYNYAYSQVMYYKNELELALFRFNTTVYESKRLIAELNDLTKKMNAIKKEKQNDDL